MTRRGVAPLPGVGLAVFGAAAGFGLHVLIPQLPWLTASLILGVLSGCVPRFRPALDGELGRGLSFAAHRLLRWGIVLLGLKLSLSAISALGWPTIVAIVLLVVLSFGATWAFGRLLRLEGDQALLFAAGFSICGISAVGAMSAARGSDQRDIATPVALVTLYGTLAIVVLPALASVLGMDATQFGHWTGATVHDVGQVVATAQTLGTTALAAAIVVKLTRVLLLAPMVALTSVVTRARASTPGGGVPAGGPRGSGVRGGVRPPIVPLFVAGFLLLVVVRTVLPVPAVVLTGGDALQSSLLAVALFAIGAGLRLEVLLRTGARALAVGFLSWVVILGLGLSVVAVANSA